MAKSPKTKRSNTVKMVKTEKKPRSKRVNRPASSYEDDNPPYWTQPSEHSLKLDKARLAHWWAKMNGGDTVATLKAWAALLHVPRTRVKSSG